jgi:signal transduction histidine kinase
MLREDRWPYIPEKLSEILDDETQAVLEAGCSTRVGVAVRFKDLEPSSPGSKARSHRSTRQQEYTCPIYVQGWPVAELIASPRQSQNDIAQVQPAAIAAGNAAPGRDGNLAASARPISPTERNASPQAGVKDRLRHEAKHIQHIAEAAYERIKHKWEQAFLDQLRGARTLGPNDDLSAIRQRTVGLLHEIKQFCRCRYVVLFANVQETGTVLTPLAHVGVPEHIGEHLPHFNWKKAGLPLVYRRINQLGSAETRDAWARGIRGDNSPFFVEATCILPTVLGNSYRGALVLGPFAEALELDREQTFLFHIARIVGWTVQTDLQILNLRQQQLQWESTAKLITHQVRTAITPIMTQVATAKLLVQKPPTEANTRLVSTSLKGAHELCQRLGMTVVETVKSHVLLLEPEDLKFEQYPLAVLVSNCVEAFMLDAEQRQRNLALHESVERLPYASVDIARLTIAFSNLIDNAIKYSFPSTRIFVRASLYHNGVLDFDNACIEVQNDGEQIPPDKLGRIFDQGERGLTGAKLRRIAGTGLGLWESRAVIEAHGGAISVKCNPTTNYYRQEQAFRTTFTITLPLQQPDRR